MISDVSLKDGRVGTGIRERVRMELISAWDEEGATHSLELDNRADHTCTQLACLVWRYKVGHGLW